MSTAKFYLELCLVFVFVFVLDVYACLFINVSLSMFIVISMCVSSFLFGFHLCFYHSYRSFGIRSRHVMPCHASCFMLHFYLDRNLCFDLACMLRRAHFRVSFYIVVLSRFARSLIFVLLYHVTFMLGSCAFHHTIHRCLFIDLAVRLVITLDFNLCSCVFRYFLIISLQVYTFAPLSFHLCNYHQLSIYGSVSYSYLYIFILICSSSCFYSFIFRYCVDFFAIFIFRSIPLPV